MERISKTACEIKNNLEKARYRQDLTLEIADSLSWAAMGEQDAEIQAVADLMLFAAQDENLFVAENLDGIDRETGTTKLFSGFGSLNVVSSRCNPAYLKMSARRGRQRIESALAMVKPQSGEKMRFIVLTQPDLFGFDFAGGDELLCRAKRRLKNHPFFKKNFRGGVTSDEFTLGAENTHFHFHTNILGYTKWLDFTEFRRVWTSCLKHSARDMGKQLVVNTKDGLANIRIKDVKPKVKDAKREITLADAITETVKYVVKGNDFAKIPTDMLCQVERALHGKRLVETFGEANVRKGKAKNNIAVLMSLFAGASSNALIPLFLVFSNYIKNQAKREKDAEREGQNLDKGYTIQDLPQAADSENLLSVREESLRKMGAKMIQDGRRDEWLAELTRKFAKRREFRKRQLAERYKFAIFVSLSGEIWRGAYVTDEQYYAYRSAVGLNAAYV